MPGWATVNGKDSAECLRALRSCVRSGREREAMLFAVELGRSQRHVFTEMADSLVHVAHQEVGVADPAAVLYVMTTVPLMKALWETGRGWGLLLADCVMALSRAPKSRAALDLHAVVKHALDTTGLPPVPDWCIDMHTSKGRKLGRGIRHFIEEGTKLDKPLPDDPYKAEAEAAWLRENRKPDFDPASGERPANFKAPKGKKKYVPKREPGLFDQEIEMDEGGS
jgi:hypothetical protein